jgi:glycosyltransferase involved in cell wall biosynthesis
MLPKAKIIRQNSAQFLSKALHHPSFSSVSKNDKNGGGEKKKTIHFFTTCPEPWGGSEELWARSARQLAGEDFRVTATLHFLDLTHPEVGKLIEAGIRLENYRGVPILRRSRTFKWRWEPVLTVARLRAAKPQLGVVSQGENLDGFRQIRNCRQADIPYVIICQKAAEDISPMDGDRPQFKDFYNQAQRVFFVSEHNRSVTEERLGLRLTNAEVISNPFKVDYNVNIPWPNSDDGRYRLALVARLWIRDKGQDILLKVLAQEKWKKRDLEVHLYGNGHNSLAITEMAQMLGVDKLKLCGFCPDVTEIWRQHHALILPSRHEGLPLVLVEAMLCGRPSIVTDVGGNTEVLEDEVSGFLARAATVEAVDDAMERAWNRRHEWQEIGRKAAALIRKKVPQDPSALFTAKLVAIHHEVTKSRQP